MTGKCLTSKVNILAINSCVVLDNNADTKVIFVNNDNNDIFDIFDVCYH